MPGVAASPSETLSLLTSWAKPTYGGTRLELACEPPIGLGTAAWEALLLTLVVDTKRRAPTGMLLKVAFRRGPKSAKPATSGGLEPGVRSVKRRHGKER